MPVLQIETELSKNDLLRGVEQLDTTDFEDFIREILQIKAKRKTKTSNNKEEELLSLDYSNKQTVIRQIISFKSLENNWDGYNSIPSEIGSASNTIFLINTIDNEAVNKIEDIYPNPHGTISISWENKAGEDISVEVGNTSMSYYVRLLSKDVKFVNNASISEEEISTLAKYINAL